MQKRPRRNPQFWSDLKAAFLAGADLRPLARAASIPEGTLLARAYRERWGDLRKAAREAVATAMPTEGAGPAIAQEREERARKHLERMGAVAEKVGQHVGELPPRECLDRIGKISTFDRVARRAYGLDEKGEEQGRPVIDVRVLTLGAGCPVRELSELNEGRGEAPVEV